MPYDEFPFSWGSSLSMRKVYRNVLAVWQNMHYIILWLIKRGINLIITVPVYLRKWWWLVGCFLNFSGAKFKSLYLFFTVWYCQNWWRVLTRPYVNICLSRASKQTVLMQIKKKKNHTKSVHFQSQLEQAWKWWRMIMLTMCHFDKYSVIGIYQADLFPHSCNKVQHNTRFSLCIHLICVQTTKVYRGVLIVLIIWRKSIHLWH